MGLKTSDSPAKQSPPDDPLPPPPPPPDCGSYAIEAELRNDQVRDYYLFTAVKQNGPDGEKTPISGNIQWASTEAGVNWAPHIYKIDAPDSCEAKFVRARFTNSCGEPQEVNYTYTAEGCPAPQEGDVACSQRHKIPVTNSVLTTAKVITPLRAESLHNRWILNKNVTSISQAYSHSQWTPATPYEYPQHSAWFKLGGYASLAMSFRTPVTPAGMRLSQFTLSWEQPGEDAGPFQVAISDCPNDFYIGRQAKGCISQFTGAGGIAAYISQPPNSIFQYCILEPDKTYYINITTQNPRDQWRASDMTEIFLTFDHDFHR